MTTEHRGMADDYAICGYHFDVREAASDYFLATCRDPRAMFSGSGRTIAEAIGQCVISNREVLGVTFDVQGPDGEVWRSTVYGQPRTRV